MKCVICKKDRDDIIKKKFLRISDKEHNICHRCDEQLKYEAKVRKRAESYVFERMLKGSGVASARSIYDQLRWNEAHRPRDEERRENPDGGEDNPDGEDSGGGDWGNPSSSLYANMEEIRHRVVRIPTADTSSEEES